MNRRENKPFIIASGGLNAHRTAVRWFQGQVGEKLIDTGIPLGNRVQVVKISRPFGIIVILLLENREIVVVYKIHLISRLRLSIA